ncbi:MAG: bifunctional methylenetetrahydrofolate dehydrogenase/methenyltetrahydrofolate cyclohydrolase FolD [Oscillospiraceae bacterium]
MAKIIDGKKISADIRAELRRETEELTRQGCRPGLAVVIVGEDAASKIYVRNKKRACEEVGIYSEEYDLPAETTQDELIALVRTLNQSPKLDGILVQLPLPRQISDKAVIAAISPEKDVDCFTAENVGRVSIGEYTLAPCTPAGCIELLERSRIEIKGKRCVVLGRSNIVGKPMAMLLLERHGTVTVCHSRTVDLPGICREADILVSAIGKAKFVTAEMVKQGAVVIDVGMNRDEQGKLCGDVDFEPVAAKASAITPVPGGVGPMTITMLLKNTVASARKRLDTANLL